MSTKPLAKQVVPGANGAESSTAQDGAVRPRDSVFHWSGTVDAIRRASDPLEKSALLGAYFEAVAYETLAPAARYFAGQLLPPDDPRAISVDRSLVAGAIEDLTRIAPDAFRTRSSADADLGEVAAEAFAGRLPSGIAVVDVESWAENLANASDNDARRVLVREMLARLSAIEARYIVKLVGGELRIGLTDEQIAEAVARRIANSNGRRRAAGAGRAR
jgi:DNA ligase 1